MRKLLLIWLLLAPLLPGCALMQPREIPVAVVCPPPPPVPAVLTDKRASPQQSTSEHLESLILQRDDSLTRARQ